MVAKQAGTRTLRNAGTGACTGIVLAFGAWAWRQEAVRSCAGAGTEAADVGAGAWLPGEGCGARMRRKP
ncbi:hypothetical protein V6Z11_A03G178100 [Gossypium hirsutum]